jgi:hypothetical protein
MPVPTSGSYSDWDIRNAIIEGGGSIGTSYSWEDLVNAADWNKFHPSYKDGATSKAGIVHDGQFRGYPYTSISCPDPVFTVSYLTYNSSTNMIRYFIYISNAAGRSYNVNRYTYDNVFNSTTLSSIVSDDGNGSVVVDKHMTGYLDLSINFYGGVCGTSATVTQTIGENYLLPSGVAVPNVKPTISAPAGCVSDPGGTIFATSSSPGGGTIYWNYGSYTGTIVPLPVGTYRVWGRNSNGYSIGSDKLIIDYC